MTIPLPATGHSTPAFLPAPSAPSVVTPCFTLADGATTLTFSGPGDRYRKNVAALRLLRQLQAEERNPAALTAEERLTLAHYTAFGDSALLRRAFDGESDDLAPLISETEARSIKRTALTAFYTSTDVLTALWAALAPQLIALRAPIHVLEPAFGTGLMIAAMPHPLRAQAAIGAVELDLVTSQIARFLHPDVQLVGGQGFEATDLPEDSYDLVISNVPFGATRVFDPRLPEAFLTRTIHDYFIARALTLVRPGGLVAVITSYGTLDKRDSRVRAWIAARAELLSAVRLPQGAFHANAGTACGADLLILRRFADGSAPQDEPPAWIETALATVPLVDDDGSGHFTFNAMLEPGEIEERADGSARLRMSRVFAEHPELVAGQTQIVRDGQRCFAAVLPPSDRSLGTALAERLADLPDPLILPRSATSLASPIHAPRRAQPRDDHSTPRVAGLLAIEAAARRVIHLDVAGADATAARSALTTAYETFVASYGPIHARANTQALRGAPELLFLKSLEIAVTQEDGTLTVRKAAIFTAPTVRATPRVVVGRMTPDEALLRCLDELGRVDIERIAALCGRSPDSAAAALQGRIYRDPTSDRVVTADEYLSGNIRGKLVAAQEAAAIDSSYAANVTALTAVLPAPLTPGQIRVPFGAPWVGADIVTAFVCTLIPTFRGFSHARGSVSYVHALARWQIADEAWSRRTHAATVTWGTSRIHALDLIAKGLNHQTPAIYDEQEDGTRQLNHQETLLAREQLERIKERWTAWVWEDADRTEQLCRTYNELFNSHRRRDFDGAHLSLPGINTAVLRDGDLAKHQKDAVWMGLQVPAVLLDLKVGAGKTFIGLAWAHELKRLGLAQKVLVTVPNHLVEQWAIEANRLYPTMRVLAMAPDDFGASRRGTFLSRIATEQWDLIICAHTSFGFIEPGHVAQEFIQRDVDALRAHLEELRTQARREGDRATRRTIKAIERKVQALETRLKERAHSVAHDDARIITWEELGIDALFVDEAHEFKNLYVPTAMGAIPGVPKGDSKRAFDMRIKTWDLRRRGGRVIFATGTPVLNTLGEVFVMQQYLQEDVLAAHGIEHFDAWARTFAETQAVFEMTPDGGGFRMTTRLCRFVNLPELFHLWFQMTFSRSPEQLGLPAPTLVSGKPIAIRIPGTSRLKCLVRSFVRRVEAIKRGTVHPSEDNMLKVTSDGRKAALDVRLVAGGAEEAVNKIAMLVQVVAEVYRRYDAARATQLIYCELSTPRSQRTQHDHERALTDGSEVGEERDEPAQEQQARGFVYEEIREKLARLGIPRAQIAFIQEHATRAKREALFTAMRRGDVRVLIASKQSTGMNIQERLIALHNLDAPWRPGDLEQRIGRIERQGNGWPEVYVFTYVTEGSFDGYIWQTLETKARFIGQMRAGDVTIRTLDDISEVVLSAAEIKAIASGNPQIMRKVQCEAELLRLTSLERAYRDTQARVRVRLRELGWSRADLGARRARLAAAFEATRPHLHADFRVSVVRSLTTHALVVSTKRAAAGRALRMLAAQALEAAQATHRAGVHTIGAYAGLLLCARAHPSMIAAELFLALEEDGAPVPLLLSPITCETDLGVFASIDSQIRGIAGAIRQIDASLTAQQREEAQAQAALEQPWEHAARLASVQAELTALNAALAHDEPVAGLPMATGAASAPPFVSVDEALEDNAVLDSALALPPVILPPPADATAMAAALRRLAALDDQAGALVEAAVQALHASAERVVDDIAISARAATVSQMIFGDPAQLTRLRAEVRRRRRHVVVAPGQRTMFASLLDDEPRHATHPSDPTHLALP